MDGGTGPGGGAEVVGMYVVAAELMGLPGAGLRVEKLRLPAESPLAVTAGVVCLVPSE